MSPRLTATLVISFVCLAASAVATAQVQTITATHTYILGDRDSKEDARQRCLLETKRKILEQAGVYIESSSEVKDLQLTKDKITSFAASVMQVKDTKEEVGFEQGHMTLTLTTTAQVDLEEVRKQLAARQVDASVRDDVASQKERLKRLETQVKAMQQQIGETPEQTLAPPPSDISSTTVQTMRTRAAQGDAEAQFSLGWLYQQGRDVPQDYVQAAKWYQKAAAQGDAGAQSSLAFLYAFGEGVPKDEVHAYMWFRLAAAHSMGVQQEIAEDSLDEVARSMTPAQIAEAQRLAQQCQARQFKGC